MTLPYTTIALHPFAQRLGLFLGFQQFPNDDIGYQKTLRGQPVAAFAVGHGPVAQAEFIHNLGKRCKGKQEFSLVLIPADAGGGPQPQHQIFAGPFSGQNFLDFPQYLAIIVDAISIFFQAANNRKPLSGKI